MHPKIPTRLAPAAIALAAATLALGAASPVEGQVHRSMYHDYRLVTVAEGLIHPWSMTWLPNGDMLVTERPGRLRIIRDGELLPDPVPGVPEVHARGQGGLLDVTLHPDFEENRLLYLSYSKPFESGEGASTAVVRGRFENDAVSDLEEIWVAQSEGAGHYGSRFAWDAEGYLYVSAGDRQVPSRGDLESHPAQDLSNHHGVIVRLHDDGRIPTDNPFIGTEGALGDIYSYGHRNPQGLAIHPLSGDIWSNEHGPQGGDEVNLIEAGANYGWPVVGYGVNYRSGSTIHVGTMAEGMEHPVHVWVPSIGVSGLTIYTGDAFPAWRYDFFSGGLSGEQLSRLTMDESGREVVHEETLVRNMGRIRDVRQGPDGFIYLAIDDRPGGPTPILRMEPAGGR